MCKISLINKDFCINGKNKQDWLWKCILPFEHRKCHGILSDPVNDLDWRDVLTEIYMELWNPETWKKSCTCLYLQSRLLLFNMFSSATVRNVFIIIDCCNTGLMLDKIILLIWNMKCGIYVESIYFSILGHAAPQTIPHAKRCWTTIDKKRYVVTWRIKYQIFIFNTPLAG